MHPGLMSKDVLAAAKMPKEMASLGRWMDFLLVPTILFVVIGSFHLHFMLTAGDWDFWVDWKDREWWTTVTPIMAITFPAALQYIGWTFFRLPIGATLCCLALILGEWIVRVVGYHWWAHYPINMVMPATLMATGVMLDAFLLVFRGNWIFTGIFGGGFFGLLFYPMNYVINAPFHEPVNYYGNLLSMADLIGYANVRTATPEYIRMIERGSLRTFGGHTTIIAAFFSGFVSVLMYWIWWFIGAALCNTNFIVKGKSVDQGKILDFNTDAPRPVGAY